MKPWGVGWWANGSDPGKLQVDSSLHLQCNSWLGDLPHSLGIPLVGMGVLLCPTAIGVIWSLPFGMDGISTAVNGSQGHQW